MHFSPVTGKEHAHNHPYNMELESTVIVCDAAWYLQKYLGVDYNEVIARGRDWVLRCRLQEISFDPPPQECGLVTQNLAELAYNGVDVKGRQAEVFQILRTL